MGTTFEFVIASFARSISGTDARAILEEAAEIVKEWHDRLTIFDRGSIVSRINATPVGQSVRIDRDLFDMLELCAQATNDTSGAFDIDVGMLMSAHGFRGETASTNANAHQNSSYSLDATRLTVTRDDAACSLDFGGIAKGFVLDRVCELLREYGVTSALLHGGTSSVACIGTMPSIKRWRIAVLDYPDAIELEDSCMSVSRIDGRVSPAGGHIMDPKTGVPVTDVPGACVVGPSAAVCEIWSTALVVDPSLTAHLPDGYTATALAASRMHKEKDLAHV